MTVAAAAAAVAAVAALAVAAAAGASETAVAALPNLSYARAQVARYRAVPTWRAPGPPIEARKAKGKTVFVVPRLSALPYQRLLDRGLRAAALAAGVRIVEEENEGQPAQWAASVEHAIAQRADLIALLGGPDLAQLRPQLGQARAAGIPVVADAADDDGGSQPLPGVAARVAVASQAGQRLAADATIARLGGGADTLIVTAGDVRGSRSLVAAIQDEYAKVCGGGCTTTVVNVPLAGWSTRLALAVRAALQADPAIDFVHPIYDSMMPYAVAGIEAAGAGRRVRLGTVDGSDYVLRMIQEKAHKGVVVFDVGTSVDWRGWADMDAILRVLLGRPVPATLELPLRLFDAANVAAAGSPPTPLQGYGSAYAAGYRRLWGLAG